jgi:tyrosyl-tRNA synthetase
MEFLRDIGKHFTINYMLAKESVKARVASPQRGLMAESPNGQKEMIASEGMSFTEFSYMLLQSYDFLTVFDRYGCTLQMGGSDQWGNITAGIDLIRRLRGAKAHGLVMPLVTTAAGVKFGKTEAGAVWLDASRTSPFRFYQFWLNTDDRDALPYLKFFTFLSRADVDELGAASAEAPESRTAQRRLAREVTGLVHGADAVARAERASAVLFGAELRDLTVDEVLDVFDDVPSSEMPTTAFDGDGQSLVDLVAHPAVRLAPSKGEARRLVQSGGVYLNNRRIADPQARVNRQQAIDGTLLVLRKGQRQNHVIKLIG